MQSNPERKGGEAGHALEESTSFCLAALLHSTGGGVLFRTRCKLKGGKSPPGISLLQVWILSRWTSIVDTHTHTHTYTYTVTSSSSRSSLVDHDKEQDQRLDAPIEPPAFCTTFQSLRLLLVFAQESAAWTPESFQRGLARRTLLLNPPRLNPSPSLAMETITTIIIRIVAIQTERADMREGQSD